MGIIPKKYMEHIEEAYKDTEGYWAFSKNGYKFANTDSHTAHATNQKEFLSDIRSMEQCDCKQCKQL